MLFRILLIVFIISSICESYSHTQDNGTIKGTVVEQKSRFPIQNAVLQILETKSNTITDSIGNFIFDKLPVGRYTLVINMPGYFSKILPNQSVIMGKVLYINIELEGDVKEVDEVEVVSFRFENNKDKPISTFSFSRDEISLNPGAQGDIFRAIGMLPGVTSSGGIYSAIAVRGQGVRDNVYMVDDIPVTEVGHLEGNSFFNDPNGGRFSIFAPRVIDNALFQGGVFSTEFGRRSASYLGLNIKEGNKGSPMYDGQIDLLGITANYDGPSYFHENTTLFLSARYQNFYPLVHLIGLQNLGLPIYSDFIIKSTTELNEFNKLNILFMICPESFVRNMDNLYEDKPLNLLYLPDFARNKIVAGLNLRSMLNSHLMMKNILYFTNYSSEVKVGKAYPEFDSEGKQQIGDIPFLSKIQSQNYTENKWGFRSIIEANLNSKSSLTFGLEGDILQLFNDRDLIVNDTNFVFRRQQLSDISQNYQVITPDLVNANFDDLRANASVFANFYFELGSKFSAQIGGRIDYSGFSEQTVFAPRSSLSYKIDNNNSFSLGFGKYYQDPVYSEIADLPKGNILKMEEVTQLIFSYKSYISYDLKLTVEAWYKSFDNMVVTPISGSVLRNNDGFGNAKGFDISITKRLHKKWHGIASYSYMDVKRNDNDGLGDYDFTYSQPHQLNIMLSYQLNQNWSFSGKYRYATGRPTDKFIIHDNVLNNQNYHLYSMELIGRNLSRLPDFSSLDLRMNYDFNISNFKLTIFFDVVNILNRQIANSENFNALKGETYFDGLAIFPTGGLKFEF